MTTVSESEVYSRWEKIRLLREQTTRQNLRALVDALKAENVTRVVMSYYGGGDSGDYHFPILTVKKEDGTTEDLEAREGYGCSSYKHDSSGTFQSDATVVLTLVHSGDWLAETKTQGDPYLQEVTKTLTTACYHLMEQAVESQHGGWYNNEGGEGTVTIDVEEGVLDVEHGDYIMETVWNSYTITAADA